METTFDRIDAGILTALQNEGRLSNKELAAKVGLAPSSCLERVRRLRETGVLKGFRAEVSHDAFGIGLQAMVAVRMSRHTVELVLGFQQEMLKKPEVVGIYYMAGADDFLVHVAVRDANHLREFILSDFTSRHEVSHVQTNLIYEHRQAREVPNYRVQP